VPAGRKKWPKADGLDAAWRNEAVMDPRGTKTVDMIDIGQLRERELANLLQEFALKMQHVKTNRWMLRQCIMDSRMILNRIEQLNAKKWARDKGYHKNDIERLSGSSK